MKKINTKTRSKWDWSLIIQEVESSGYSVGEYCKRNGLYQEQYHYWANRIKGNLSENNELTSKAENITEIVFAEESNNESGLSIYFDDKIKLVPDKNFCEREFLRIIKLLRG